MLTIASRLDVMNRLGRAMADPTRSRILMSLLDGPSHPAVLSRELELPTWDKQSFACLSSRFVYGELISRTRLAMVDRAEQELLDLGLTQVRVRVHGEKDPIARIEVLPEEFGLLVAHAAQVAANLRALGFSYVTMDLAGYHTGSMNQSLGEARA